MTKEQIEQAAANHKAYAEEFNLKADLSFICGIDWYRNHQWISVEEELPPYEEDVFVMNADGDTFGCWRSNNDVEYKDENDFVNYHPTKITHWMSIPKIGGEE